MNENRDRLPSWLPREQPRQALTIFAIVAVLAALPIAFLAEADGNDSFELGERVGPPTRKIERPKRLSPSPPPVTTVPAPTQPPVATTPTPPPTPSPTPAPSPSTPTEKPPVLVGVGETGIDDGVAFTVTDVSIVRRVRADRFGGRDDILAPAGGSLAKVKVTYANHTRMPVDPFCGSQSARAIDQYDRPHELTESLYEVPGNTEICGPGDGIDDGDSASVTLVFELPNERRLKAIELYNAKASDYDGQASFVRVRVR